jgi:PTS system mannose-specific IIC component
VTATAAVLGALVLWGTLVGLDLVSVPQMMIARPLVAGAGAGLLLGDLGAGLVVGLVLELFQYAILPVGAVRYPEYGPATVAAVAVAQAGGGMAAASGGGDRGGVLALGLAVLVGLITAMAGGLSLHQLRRLNARVVHAADAVLEAGDPAVLVRLHAAAIGRDAIRAALVTAFGLGLAWVARFAIGTLTARDLALLDAVAIGAGFAAAAAGLLRVVGTGSHRRWLAAGLVGGMLTAWLA